ncbi:MAG: hypothetical protein AB7I37_04540 [Pirellulales bacterium]
MLLQSLSSATGGAFVDVEQITDLAAKLPRKERRTSHVERTELGGSPWLFVFFLAAVTAEWLLRRKNHLV